MLLRVPPSAVGFLFSFFLLLLLLLLGSPGAHAASSDNVGIRWAELLNDRLAAPLGGGPTIGPNRATAIGQSRAVFTLSSCMYDAWAVYDSRALASTIRTGTLKGMPRAGGSAADISKAVSFAAYAALNYLLKESESDLAAVNDTFASLGYDPSEINTDLDNPAGVGTYMCDRVIDERKADGTNSEGDHPTSQNPGVPYADYTNYQAVNDPQATSGVTDCNALRNIAKWVPLRLSDGSVQEYNVPYMSLVKPFALESNTQFPPPGPPIPDTSLNSDWVNQFQALVPINAALGDLEKLTAEIWAAASGGLIFQKFTYQAARNRSLSLGDTVKLLFAQGVAIWDAGISAWTFKGIYDSARPVTVIPCINEGNNIDAWQGLYQGSGSISAANFQPYLPTPPFSEYLSGHSAFTAASAVVLNSFFGTDTFYAEPWVVLEGQSMTEPEISDSLDPDYVDGLTNVANTGPGTPGYVPATDFTIQYTTWTEAAEAAGISRLYGGFHINSSNVDSLELGRQVGQQVWTVCSELFNTGSVSAAPSRHSGALLHSVLRFFWFGQEE